MMNLKRPILWLYVGAGLIFLYSAMKLVAVVGPSVVLGTAVAEEGAPFLAKLSMGFDLYIQEVAKKFNQTQDYVHYAFISSFAISSSLAATSIFIVCRQNWARILFLVLVGVIAVNFAIIAALFGGGLRISGVDAMTYPIFFGVLVWLFTRKEVCDVFTVKKTDITRPLDTDRPKRPDWRVNADRVVRGILWKSWKSGEIRDGKSGTDLFIAN